MRLSDERLALLARHRSLALAEDVRALVAEVRALRECESVLSDIRATFSGNESDGSPAPDGAYWLGHSLALRIHSALAGVRALEDKP